MRLASIFRSCSRFRAFWIFLPVLACASTARGETGRVPPPRPEHDEGPPPLPRAPEHGRRPAELVSDLGLFLPTCRDDFFAERCAALAPAVGATFVALHRPNPYFAFGAGVSYARARAAPKDGSLDVELFAVGAWGRVYFHEEGAFEPYLELELGYGSLETTFVESSGARHDHAAFGPIARVGGGLDFSLLPALRLGGSVGFTHFLLDHGALVGAVGFGLRATVLLGNEL